MGDAGLYGAGDRDLLSEAPRGVLRGGHGAGVCAPVSRARGAGVQRMGGERCAGGRVYGGADRPRQQGLLPEPAPVQARGACARGRAFPKPCGQLPRENRPDRRRDDRLDGGRAAPVDRNRGAGVRPVPVRRARRTAARAPRFARDGVLGMHGSSRTTSPTTRRRRTCSAMRCFRSCRRTRPS